MERPIDETTDPKCLQCPINAKCMVCEYMMQKVKERREKYEADRCGCVKRRSQFMGNE